MSTCWSQINTWWWPVPTTTFLWSSSRKVTAVTHAGDINPKLSRWGCRQRRTGRTTIQFVFFSFEYPFSGKTLLLEFDMREVLLEMRVMQSKALLTALALHILEPFLMSQTLKSTPFLENERVSAKMSGQFLKTLCNRMVSSKRECSEIISYWADPPTDFDLFHFSFLTCSESITEETVRTENNAPFRLQMEVELVVILKARSSRGYPLHTSDGGGRQFLPSKSSILFTGVDCHAQNGSCLRYAPSAQKVFTLRNLFLIQLWKSL